MFRWLLVVFLALLLINSVTPWLQKLGFGRLPGDIRFRLFGREIFIPLTSTIILSLVCAGISKLLEIRASSVGVEGLPLFVKR